MSPPTSDTEDAFTSVTHKKPARAPRNRKGKQNKPRVRTLEERVASRRVGLVDSGYLRECRGTAGTLPRTLGPLTDNLHCAQSC